VPRITIRRASGWRRLVCARPFWWREGRARGVWTMRHVRSTPIFEDGAAEAAARRVFARVVAGTDGTEAGLEAVRQVARLLEGNGWIEVFTAVNLVETNLAGWSARRFRAEHEQEAHDALRQAVAVAGGRAEQRLAHGRASQSLLRELREKK